MSSETFSSELRWAIDAAQGKQAAAITLLDLRGLGAFTDYFLVCTGLSTPQVAAITEAIEERLKAHDVRPTHREGRSGAEWLLLDYGGFIVHIFSERLREYYHLERLWRSARRFDVTDSFPDASSAGERSA